MNSPLERMIWAADVPLKATGPKGCAQRCLLQLLARRVGLDLRCIIGQHKLRQDSRLSEEPVANALKGLEDEGLIARRPRYGPHPNTGKIVRLADEYVLLIAENPISARANDDEAEGPDRVTRKIGDTEASVTPDLPLSNPGFSPKPAEIRGAEGGTEGGTEGGSARESLDDLFGKMPFESQRGSSLILWRRHWAMIKQPPPLAELVRAVRAYAADTSVRPDRAHFWLSQEQFRHYAGQPNRGQSSEPPWRDRMRALRGPDRIWIESMWGPRPGEKGCQCPQDIIDEFPPKIGGVAQRDYAG